MPFEQKRNAERLPLVEPLDATAGGVAVKIVELSAIGCRIEHQEKIAIGTSAMLRFEWQDRTIEVRGKVARTQMRSASTRGMFYESGLHFADSLAAAPEQLRDLMASIVVPELPPPVDKVATAEVPSFTQPPPPTPGEDTLRRLRLATERESKLPLEAFAPVEEPIAYDLASDFEAPPTASNPFASQSDAVALAVEPQPEVETPPREYVECRLENGAWHRRIVTSLLQPPEGFVTLPADNRELDMLCKSYEYADPDTRRLIRISLELAATQKPD